MKKVLLCILLLCTSIAAIPQNPILLKDVYPGVTGSGIQQIVKTNNYIFFNDEDADTERSLLRTDGTPTSSSKYDLSYTAYSNFTIDYSFNSAAIDNWGVVGSATQNGWVGPDMPLTYDANANTWSAVVSLSNGEIKFRNNNDWAFNYGDNGADGSLDAGGSNIAVAAGTYLITLDFTTLNYSLKTPFISIPDPIFEQALIDLGYDKDGVINASISTSDAEAITQLDVTGKNISSLQGIEAFINLSRLFCQNNQLQVLDISKNIALTVLECGGNQLTTLNVSKNLLLRTLGFGYNNISAIDVSKNLKLEVFWCNSNNITSQNLDLNSALTVVGLSNNPLTFVSLKNGNNSKIVYFEAYNTPTLVCINSDAVVSVSMTNSGKTFSESCSAALLAGRWIIAPETAALKVGPAPGSDAWWYLNKFGNDIAARACYMDDKYVFGKDGSFRNVLGSATFLEPWQGVASEQCGAPVAPHNGADASYVYDQNAGTITLNGKGAYLGLPKVTNNYYLPNGPVPNSITYQVAFSENGNVMTLSIGLQGGFWTYKLIKESIFKTYYVNDNSSTGDLLTTATGNNANAGTKAAPFATLTYALSQAGEGDTVYVDAGSYAEQVIINKGITIIGAGQTLTSFTPPTTLVPAPGPFTEIGLFETTQGIGDVHIRNLSINSINGNSQNIIIQSGGSVTNCTLLNGGQGVFFRIESGTKTALVENNTIQPTGIGINCQGSGLTATIRQNTIFSTNGYYAGIFAGLDFGPIVQLTANNNIINNYFGNGLLANSFNSNFTQNSIVGLNGQGVAIQQFSGNTANASCNWYGSALAATVVSKITGGVTYSPWLIDGTDNSPAVGFQTSATCPVANSFYVNDNSTTGDVFTTAVGNDANSGTFNGPFATLNYAISQVPPGATIFVDAGTYVENVVVNKSITLRGAKYGQNPGSSLNRGNETIIIPAVSNTTFSGMIMKPAADNITIDGFLLDGDNPALTNGTIVNGVDVNVACGIYNDAIASSYLTVKNNIVKNAATYGIGLFRAFGNTTGPVMPGALFTQNRVDNASRGIVLAYNAYGNITNNQISRCGGSGTWFSQHRVANLNNSPSYVSGNTIENCGLGMQSSSLDPAASVVHYVNNDITGLSSNFAGISLLINNIAGVVLSNNKISGPPVGVYINSTNSSAPVLVNNNSFSSISTFAIQSVGNFPVLATCNWYGSSVGDDVKLKISSPNVQYIPWLTNGTDNDVATGFQPVANVCNGYQRTLYVNDNNPTGDIFTTAVGKNTNPGTAAAPFATPDYAYSIAQPGDTIYVDAGTYDLGGLTYSFPKAITFLGTNYQISPNVASNKLLPNTARNAESIFTNGKMVIASNDISIEGFTWDVGNRTGIELVNTLLTNNDFGSFRFVKNIYKITHTSANLNSFLITGKFVTSPAMPVTSGFNIEDNRFEKSDTAAGTTFNFNYVKNILIKDNSFVVTGSTFRRQQIANLGNTGIVELFEFADNVAENAGVIVNSNRVASGITSGNKLINTDRALNVSSAMPESSSIEFSNNIVESTIGGGGFIGYNRSGTSLPGATTTFKVENNVFTSIALPNMPLQLFGSMNFTVSNSVLNPSFMIRGNKINYSGDFSLIANEFIRPITVRGNVADLTLESNEIVINNTGTSLYPLVVTALPPNPAITINTDFGNTAYMPANAVINILNNKVQGFKQSVVFYDATTGGKDGYQGYGNLPAGATVNINNNSFAGDSISINNGSVGASVNATCNWFGTASAQTILTKVSSNSAQVFPYLTDGTDTDAATGFQPTANTCDGSVPLIILNSFTNATCIGAANGTVNITASFGKAPFVFTWTKVGDANFTSNNEDPNNFTAGTYRLAVTDANGTTIYKTSMEGEAPGIIEVTIAEPTAVTASITNSSTACSNIAIVAAGGGTPGYTYLWSNGSTSPTISGVPVGTYNVTVTDANGCTATASVTLTVSEAFNPSASVTDVTCFGAANGSITVTNINGTAPFMFSKDGGVSFEVGSLLFNFNNLAPGSYNIAVKDANGCTGFVERTVTQPTALTATIGSVQSTCFGGSTGAINITVSGGTPAYSYSWTGLNGAFSSSQLNISGLAAGSYTLTVTDKNNCTTSIPVVVPSIAAIIVTETVNNVTCRGAANGSITVGASGGTNSPDPAFSYLWNTGATTTTISNLAPGNYSVRITDNGSGCFVNKSYTILQPALALSLATAKTNATGCNSLGTITANGSGGTAPYTYSVNGTTINGNSIGGLYGGDYNITVTDANGCTTSRLVAITDNGSDEYEGNNSKNQAKPILVGTAINARLALSNDAADWFTITAPGSTTGLYSVKITHPTAAYTVAVFASGKNTTALVPVSVITNGERHYQLTAGATYFVSITTTTLSYTCYSFSVSALEPIEGAPNRTESKIVAAPTVEILKAFTYPNPHNGNFTLSIESPEEGVATVELYTVNGQKLSERKANVVKGKGNTLKYSNMKYAILFYKVRIGNHVVTGKIISPN